MLGSSPNSYCTVPYQLGDSTQKIKGPGLLTFASESHDLDRNGAEAVVFESTTPTSNAHISGPDKAIVK